MMLRLTLPCLATASILALLGCDSAETSCVPGVTSTGCPAKTKVRVTSVGFLPGAGKRATYVGAQSDFSIKNLSDDMPVFEGIAGDEIDSTDTGEKVHIVDFTDLRAPGQYYVDVTGVARSNPFTIADDVFSEPFLGAMLGMHGLRCGSAVHFSWQGIGFGHG